MAETPGVLAPCAGTAESASAPASTTAAVDIKLRGDLDRDARFLTTFTLSLFNECNGENEVSPLPPTLNWVERLHFNRM